MRISGLSIDDYRTIKNAFSEYAPEYEASVGNFIKRHSTYSPLGKPKKKLSIILRIFFNLIRYGVDIGLRQEESSIVFVDLIKRQDHADRFNAWREMLAPSSLITETKDTPDLVQFWHRVKAFAVLLGNLAKIRRACAKIPQQPKVNFLNFLNFAIKFEIDKAIGEQLLKKVSPKAVVAISLENYQGFVHAIRSKAPDAKIVTCQHGIFSHNYGLPGERFSDVFITWSESQTTLMTDQSYYETPAKMVVGGNILFFKGDHAFRTDKTSASPQDGTCTILYISSPFNYNGTDINREVIAALNESAPTIDCNIHVKLHPSESVSTFSDLKNVTIIKDNSKKADKFFPDYDMVAGLIGTSLIEAAMLGYDCVQIKPKAFPDTYDLYGIPVLFTENLSTAELLSTAQKTIDKGKVVRYYYGDHADIGTYRDAVTMP